jgi:hypothetical protein
MTTKLLASTQPEGSHPRSPSLRFQALKLQFCPDPVDVVLISDVNRAPWESRSLPAYSALKLLDGRGHVRRHLITIPDSPPPQTGDFDAPSCTPLLPTPVLSPDRTDWTPEVESLANNLSKSFASRRAAWANLLDLSTHRVDYLPEAPAILPHRSVESFQGSLRLMFDLDALTLCQYLSYKRFTFNLGAGKAVTIKAFPTKECLQSARRRLAKTSRFPGQHPSQNCTVEICSEICTKSVLPYRFSSESLELQPHESLRILADFPERMLLFRTVEQKKSAAYVLHFEKHAKRLYLHRLRPTSSEIFRRVSNIFNCISRTTKQEIDDDVSVLPSFPELSWEEFTQRDSVGKSGKKRPRSEPATGSAQENRKKAPESLGTLETEHLEGLWRKWASLQNENFLAKETPCFSGTKSASKIDSLLSTTSNKKNRKRKSSSPFTPTAIMDMYDKCIKPREQLLLSNCSRKADCVDDWLEPFDSTMDVYDSREQSYSYLDPEIKETQSMLTNMPIYNPKLELMNRRETRKKRALRVSTNANRRKQFTDAISKRNARKVLPPRSSPSESLNPISKAKRKIVRSTSSSTSSRRKRGRKEVLSASDKLGSCINASLRKRLPRTSKEEKKKYNCMWIKLRKQFEGLLGDKLQDNSLPGKQIARYVEDRIGPLLSVCSLDDSLAPML